MKNSIIVVIVRHNSSSRFGSRQVKRHLIATWTRLDNLLRHVGYAWLRLVNVRLVLKLVLSVQRLKFGLVLNFNTGCEGYG